MKKLFLFLSITNAIIYIFLESNIFTFIISFIPMLITYLQYSENNLNIHDVDDFNKNNKLLRYVVLYVIAIITIILLSVVFSFVKFSFALRLSLVFIIFMILHSTYRKNILKKIYIPIEDTTPRNLIENDSYLHYIYSYRILENNNLDKLVNEMFNQNDYRPNDNEINMFSKEKDIIYKYEFNDLKCELQQVDNVFNVYVTDYDLMIGDVVDVTVLNYVNDDYDMLVRISGGDGRTIIYDDEFNFKLGKSNKYKYKADLVFKDKLSIDYRNKQKLNL